MFSGGAEGALLGSKFGLVGTVAGGLGGIAVGAFSKSPEQKRKEQIQAYLKAVEQQRNQTLQRGAVDIGKQVSGLTKRFRTGAAARSAALGHGGNTEGSELAVAQAVGEKGTNALSSFETQTNNQFDQEKLAAQQQLDMGGQQEPTALNYLQTLAPSVMSYIDKNKQQEITDTQNQEYMNLLKNYYPNNQSATNAMLPFNTGMNNSMFQIGG